MEFVRLELVRPGDRVLDVGAGNGRQAIGLLEIGISQYVGLEVDPGSVRHGNEAFNHPRVRFDLLDVNNQMYNPDGEIRPEEVKFPYSDSSFDLVIAASLYTHLERLQVVRRYVSETARVLDDDGCAFMSFFRHPPNSLSSSALRSVFEESAIRSTLDQYFDIVADYGGSSTAFHDQWMLYLHRKPAPTE